MIGAASAQPRRMKVSPRSAPLQPEELRRVRELLVRAARGEILEEHLSPADVAERVGLSRRQVLELVRAGKAFPNATKPFANVVRIPASDVVSFLRKHRVQARALSEEAGDE